MDSPRPFPLSRFIHYGQFRFYYAFGNTQAEDFLQGVPDSDSRDKRPTILSLGCGDIRSCFYTLWKNFCFEKSKVGSRFQGVDFVLNDFNAAVLARNILFLYFCTKMPEGKTSMKWKEWIATVWSIWYNHELTQEHAHALYDALDQLLQWSDSAKEWSRGQLGSIVHFATPGTHGAIRQVWQMWYSQRGKEQSVETMKLARQDLQEKLLKKHGSATKSAYGYVNRFIITLLDCNEKIDSMVKTYANYITVGTATAESVLDLPYVATPSVANITLLERSDGAYTLHYGLVPYLGFPQSIPYSHAEMTRTQPKTSLQDAPVKDKHFKKAPLLANTVQQFSMWLTAAAKLMKQMEPSVFTVTIDCSDVIHLCSRLRQSSHSIGHLPASPLFDAIYASNLLDHVSPAVLVLTATSLLRPDGTLNTSSIHQSFFPTPTVYLKDMFGFLPELFPIILGIRCIGNDGQYSSFIAHEPVPYHAQDKANTHKLFLWKRLQSTKLVTPSLQACMTYGFLNCCRTVCQSSSTFSGTCGTLSIETLIVILHSFLVQLDLIALPTYQFWEPLSILIRKDETLKPHLLQLQTQTLLHDLHMHITVSEADCPLCTGKPISDYIGQYSISFDLCCASETPAFGVHLQKKSDSYFDCALITSVAGNSNGQKLQLDFFMPKKVIEQYSFYTVYKYKNEVFFQNRIVMASGKIKDLTSTMPFSKYCFMKKESTPPTPINEFGKITKHVGDSSTFYTALSLTDSCATGLKCSRLKANPIKPSQMQLMCGESHQITITYPFSIDPSNVHIKVSNKERSITMTTTRAIYCFYNEETTFYVDPDNRLAFPPFHCSHNTLMTYCNLQMPKFDENKNMPLYNAKNTVMHLLTKASAGEKYFSFGYMSEGVPNSYAFVHVHGVLFDQKFKTPVLDLSYCFLDRQPPHIKFQLCIMNVQICGDHNVYNILVDDKVLELLKKILPYFASITREADPNAIEIPQQKYEVWKFFNRASVYPLYPNIENDQIRHFISILTQHLATDSDERLPQHQSLSKEPSKMTQDECSLCKRKSDNMKKCAQCGEARYCGKECQRKHWKYHKAICKPSPKSSAPGSVPASAASKKQNSTADPTASCTSGNTHNTATHTPLQPLPTEPSTMTQDECSFCKCNSDTMKKCTRCGEAQYCGKECQREHWKDHKATCKPSTKSSTPGSISASAASKKQNSTADPTASCTSGNTHDTPTSKHAAPTGGNTKWSAACKRCNKQANRKCSCKSVAYCSTVCQRLEWPIHKQTCTCVAHK